MRFNKIKIEYILPHNDFINIIKLKGSMDLSTNIINKINENKIKNQSMKYLEKIAKKDFIDNKFKYNIYLDKILQDIFDKNAFNLNFDNIFISQGKLICDIEEKDYNIFHNDFNFNYYNCPSKKNNQIKLSKELEETLYINYGKIIFNYAHYEVVLDKIIEGSINIEKYENILKYYYLLKNEWLKQDIFQYEFNKNLKEKLKFKGYSTSLKVSTYRNVQTILVQYDNEDEIAPLFSDGWQNDENDNVVFKGNDLSAHEFFEKVFEKDYDNIKTDGATLLPLTLQITDECNLCCTYCYQINKGHRKMTKETAKKTIDYLLNITEENTTYLDIKNLLGITIEFVGGDGLMDIDLIDFTLNYFLEKAINMSHPWANTWKAYISTNGVLYRAEKTQSLLSKWNNNLLSLAITVDGNKELHDSCRIFPDGSGSYDFAIDANLDLLKKDLSPSSKITLSPDNLKYFSDSIIDYIEKGFLHIWFNGIFEHEWTCEEGRDLYYQLKTVIDYIFNNNLENKINLKPLKITNFRPENENNNNNFCGGNGRMLMVDPDGIFHNCTRYSSSSLGDEQPPLIIGDCYNGIGVNSNQIDNINLMQNITRRSQSTDECFYCPIATGCSWCSAYNYQKFGTPNKRTTTTCNFHKAEALAAIYYWKKYFKLNKKEEEYLITFDYSFVKNIISEEEYNMLYNL